MKRKLSLGIQDFRTIREEGRYYIDKTRLIEEFLDYGNEVILVTRPRRFGKTLNMSMMAEFFDITKNSGDVFKDTLIENSDYFREMNHWPVIFISFANVKGSQEAVLLTNLFEALANTYQQYYHLLESPRVSEITHQDIQLIFSALKNSNGDWPDLKLKVMYALQKLSRLLYEVYGKKVYIFIDEYDTPFIEAYSNGYYENMKDLLFTLLSSALKGNPYLKASLLTGIQRVARENIFSGLNNLLVCTVKDPEFSDCFGFTEEETRRLLTDYRMSLTPEVKAMYDGYWFDRTEIYNPWSMINYVQRGRLESYWVNTSENKIIRGALSRCSPLFGESYEKLVTDGEVTAFVQLQTSFYELESDASLWGLFVNSGFVTIIKQVEEDCFLLKIPNREVKRAFKELTSGFMGVEESALASLFLALKQGAMEVFARQYKQLLLKIPSYYDLISENSYHMMMLGMCAFLYNDYQIESNREQGMGRSDIMLISRNSRNPHIIMEFKYTREHPDDLVKLAGEALLQIRNKRYGVNLSGRIFYIGIAGCAKAAELAWEEEFV